jgi:hypothetical protein
VAKRPTLGLVCPSALWASGGDENEVAVMLQSDGACAPPVVWQGFVPHGARAMAAGNRTGTEQRTRLKKTDELEPLGLAEAAASVGVTNAEIQRAWASGALRWKYLQGACSATQLPPSAVCLAVASLRSFAAVCQAYRCMKRQSANGQVLSLNAGACARPRFVPQRPLGARES